MLPVHPKDELLDHKRERCLTSRAQARGADDVLRDSGTGTAIPRCLQRFVRHQM